MFSIENQNFVRYTDVFISGDTPLSKDSALIMTAKYCNLIDKYQRKCYNLRVKHSERRITMRCNNCGAELTPNAKFCIVCGSVVDNSTPAAPVYTPPAAPVAEPVYTPTQPVTDAPAAPVNYPPVDPVYAPEAEAPASAPEKKEGFKIDVAAVKTQLADTLKPVLKIFSNKLVRIGVIGGFALLVVLAIVSSILTSGNGFVNVKQDVELVENGDTLHIFVNGKEIKDTIDLPVRKNSQGEDIVDSETEEAEYYYVSSIGSMDCKVTAIWVYGTTYEFFSEDKWDYDSYSCGDLYVLNGKKIQKVAEDVVSYDMSVTGKSIAYMTRNDRDAEFEPETYTLNLYTVGNKKTAKVSSDVGKTSVELSPDGKSVAYFEGDFEINAEEKEYTAEYELMLYSGKKSTKITDKEVRLAGISNGGKYIYAIRIEKKEDADTEYSLYCYNKKGEGTKIKAVDTDYEFFLNKDHTQILFYNEGKTYIANKNKEPIRASSKVIRLMTPDTAKYITNSYTYPVKNLFDQIYICSDRETTALGYTYTYDAYLIKKNPEKNKRLIANATSIAMDDSAEYLYYTTKSDDLKCAKISDGDKAATKAKEIAQDVDSFLVTSNRKLVYFISDDNLYCVNGKKGGKAKTVYSDDNVVDFALSKNNVLFYLVKDKKDDDYGDLYVTSNSKKGKLVESDIEGVGAGYTGIIYAESKDTLFVSTGSKKLNSVLERDD